LEEDNGRSFNCAESIMIRVDRESSLPGFNDSLMRVASVLGGGFAGCGEVCGAASGGVLCLALMTGTRGTETIEEFEEKRRFARSVINDFMNEFANDWESVECNFLRAMDSGQIPTKGRLRNKPRKNLCEEYVDWCTEKVLNIRKNLNI
jgi:C_GCAxxG_C_C family probable redox protein